MADHSAAGSWIGASLLRKEDARYLEGRGMFIADVRMPALQDISFVRSQMANAHVRQVTKPSDAAARVFTLADIQPLAMTLWLLGKPGMSSNNKAGLPICR